jgi:hypothetical protein
MCGGNAPTYVEYFWVLLALFRSKKDALMEGLCRNAYLINNLCVFVGVGNQLPLGHFTQSVLYHVA